VALKAQDAKDIAQLARLQVSEMETEKLLRDLNQILDYVKQLKEVDVEGVLETSHPVQHAMPFRDDKVGSSLSRKEALMNGLDEKDSCFQVPKVIG
jgi:aspartyl-tRNA(Asn)/glutamyl-tRNA(Gln) amidotransferase subunit C